MAQDADQLVGMFAPVVPSRFRDVIEDHGADALAAFRRFRQILCESDGGHLGYVLVFGDGAYLVLGQSAEGETIFEGNHGAYHKAVGAPQ